MFAFGATKITGYCGSGDAWFLNIQSSKKKVGANSAVEDVGDCGIVFSVKFTTYSRSILDETATCSARMRLTRRIENSRTESC